MGECVDVEGSVNVDHIVYDIPRVRMQLNNIPGSLDVRQCVNVDGGVCVCGVCG